LGVPEWTLGVSQADFGEIFKRTLGVFLTDFGSSAADFGSSQPTVGVSSWLWEFPADFGSSCWLWGGNCLFGSIQ